MPAQQVVGDVLQRSHQQWLIAPTAGPPAPRRDAPAVLGKLVCERLWGATVQRAFALLLLPVGTFVAVESLLSW